MLGNYLPILLFLITAIVIGGIAMAAGRLLRPNKPDAAKLSPYECGFEAFENARMKFDVRYYLVAIYLLSSILKLRFFSPGRLCLMISGCLDSWR